MNEYDLSDDVTETCTETKF